jgi:hypothetical protein
LEFKTFKLDFHHNLNLRREKRKTKTKTKQNKTKQNRKRNNMFTKLTVKLGSNPMTTKMTTKGHTPSFARWSQSKYCYHHYLNQPVEVSENLGKV